MNSPTKRLHGLVVEPLGYVVLLEHAVAHHGDAFAKCERFRLIVRHVDRRHCKDPLDPRDLGSHLHAELRVEVGQRLVRETPAVRARSPGPSLRAGAGRRTECVGACRERPGGREPRQRSSRGGRSPPCRTSAASAEGHVPVGGHVRVGSVVLEHHRDVSILRREVVHDPTADPTSRFRYVLEPGDHAEGGRLSAKGRRAQ